MGANVGKILKGSYCVAFIALAWYFLYVRNADTMYFMQDRGWWNSTWLFWDDCVRLPGGFLSWAGAYLTQFFYYPALGCSMLITLWVLTFGLAKWSFKVPNEWSFLLFIPMAALLCSDIQLGYWVYIEGHRLCVLPSLGTLRSPAPLCSLLEISSCQREGSELDSSCLDSLGRCIILLSARHLCPACSSNYYNTEFL